MHIILGHSFSLYFLFDFHTLLQSSSLTFSVISFIVLCQYNDTNKEEEEEEEGVEKKTRHISFVHFLYYTVWSLCDRIRHNKISNHAVVTNTNTNMNAKYTAPPRSTSLLMRKTAAASNSSSSSLLGHNNDNNEKSPLPLYLYTTRSATLQYIVGTRSTTNSQQHNYSYLYTNKEYSF